jgi:hypothetical protein
MSATRVTCRGCGEQFWSRRDALYCTNTCRQRAHRERERQRRAIELLEADRASQTPTTSTTSRDLSDAFLELGNVLGDYDHYHKRMRPGAELAFRCEYAGCGRAFRAQARQRFCSISCRDRDRNDKRRSR